MSGVYGSVWAEGQCIATMTRVTLRGEHLLHFIKAIISISITQAIDCLGVVGVGIQVVAFPSQPSAFL